jgi:hypothetical protein
VVGYDHHCGVLDKCVGAGNAAAVGCAGAALCASGALALAHAAAALVALAGAGGGGGDGALWVAGGAALAGAAAGELLSAAGVSGRLRYWALAACVLRAAAVGGWGAVATAALRAGGVGALPPLLALPLGAAGCGGGAALAAGLRGGCPPRAPRCVPFWADASLLLAALARAREEHARAALAPGVAPPTAGEAPWAARCTEAMCEALGGSGRLPLALALAAAAEGAPGVLWGWAFLPSGLVEGAVL